MIRPRPMSLARLRGRLREADPARSSAPGAEEAALARVAARLAHALADAPPARTPLLPALALLAALAVAIGIPALLSRDAAAPAALRGATAGRIGHDLRSPRQVQFETPGGTRLIWVLDPDSQL